MTDTTGNFQDLLQFSQDTLYNLGEAFSVGNSAASTITVGFSNTGGQLMLAAAQTTNQTLWFPSNSSGNATLLTNVLVSVEQSGGTTGTGLSVLIFQNSTTPSTLFGLGNVSFGMSGSTITANVRVASVIVQDGVTFGSYNDIFFWYSNNVSFGLNTGAGIITASAYINVSAGTTSNNLSAITFSNLNGVSFGLNGSVITASAGGGIAIADDNGNTISNSTVQFSNIGGTTGVSFGLNGSIMTGQILSPTITVSGGTKSYSFIAGITFSNSNNVTFGMDFGPAGAAEGATITATVASSLTAINLSAGTTSQNLSAIVFSNSNNVSFGLNGSTVTASANLTGDWYDNVAAAEPNATGAGAIGSVTNFTGSASSLFVAPLHGFGNQFPFDITANTCFFPDVSISGSTATMSIAFTSKWFIGVYTLNASSLSLLNSCSVSFGFAGAATNNSTAFAGGWRYATIHSSLWSSSPVFNYGSRYWMAWFWSSAGATNQTDAMAGAFFFSSGQRSGLLGVSNLTATSNGWAPFYGIYTAQTAALPVSIGSNQLQKTGSMAGFVPHLIMANNASLTVF